MIFINLKKVYDLVLREVLWKAMKKKGVLVPYIQTIQNMYDEITTSVKTPSEETKDFPTRVAFCPYLIKYGMCLPET